MRGCEESRIRDQTGDKKPGGNEDRNQRKKMNRYGDNRYRRFKDIRTKR